MVFSLDRGEVLMDSAMRPHLYYSQYYSFHLLTSRASEACMYVLLGSSTP
jgi:hypothetical protein